MNEALLNKKVQEFLRKNQREDVAKIALKKSPFPEISSQELATQLFGLKKAKKKLPSWFEKDFILYPPGLNLEQTSSEITARYKAGLIKGSSLADITGGFGIDSFLFAEKIKKVVHCELNPELSRLVQHNTGIFGIDNLETKVGDGLEFLRNSAEDFSWIYVDPSRRDNSGGKVFYLSDCLPDVPGHLDLLFSRSSQIMIKTSPLLDIRAGIQDLKKVAEIHIVAVDNDVKELLWILRKNAEQEIKIRTVNFRKEQREVFESNFGESFSAEYSSPLSYLYEPNAAIMKSGLFDAVAYQFGLNKLHPNTHLYTSEEVKDFPGRSFKIKKVLPFKTKSLSGIEKAHISTRNFPLGVAELRKKFKIKDGGNDYIFFTTGPAGEKLVLQTVKL